MKQYTTVGLTGRFGIILLLALALSFGSTAMAKDSGKKVSKASKKPLIMLKKTEKRVRRMLAKPTKANTKRHEAKKQALKKVINKLFDFEELGRHSLGDHWKDRTPKEQKEFIGLLRALIEKNYLMRTSEQTRYKAKFVGFENDGENARVTVKVKSGNYELNFTFAMYAHPKGGWFIYDMIIDDVSLIENYQTEFNKIIKKKGFNELLGKMREKLDED